MRRIRNSSFVVAIILMLNGCGDPKLTPIESAPEDPSGDLHLFISDQSFATSPVDIRVSMDGTPVIQRDFEVGNQHNWQEFVFKLAPGPHTIVVTSVKGKATFEATFEMEDKLTGVLNYWYYPKGYGATTRHFSFQVSKGPVHFM